MENITSYTYDADDERYMVTFTRERDLSKRPMIDDLHGPRRVLAKLARFDGAYSRFTGQVKVQRFQSLPRWSRRRQRHLGVDVLRTRPMILCSMASGID